MPIYEYYCPTCTEKFEVLRPMSKANEDADCPQGHSGAVRTLSVFASFSRDAAGATTAIAGSAPSCTACATGNCESCSF